MMFTYTYGKTGEINLYFCGMFIAVCNTWEEVEEKKELFLEV